MTQDIRISRHPVFAPNTFRDHPDLFARFDQNSPDHLQSQYRRLWQSMPGYEGALTWPMVSAPGFWGGAHPGSDTVFVDIMVGINSYVYNSDCLYVNPSQRLFAISDPPGITTGSRSLFERLDRYLKTSQDGLEVVVNRLNEETRPSEGATLSLVHIPEGDPHTAQVMVAGDTLLFRGNAREHTLTPVSGTQDFIGTPYATFRVQEIGLAEGDFFIIASDGILSLSGADPERNLRRALAAQMNGRLDDFVRRTLVAANAYYEEKILDRSFGRFGGNDNVSLLLVYPEQVRQYPAGESIILGGYIEPRP